MCIWGGDFSISQCIFHYAIINIYIVEYKIKTEMKTAFSGFISTLYTVKEKISELTGKSIKLLNLKYKEKKKTRKKPVVAH